jgi:hypothetical protein
MSLEEVVVTKASACSDIFVLDSNSVTLAMKHTVQQ